MIRNFTKIIILLISIMLGKEVSASHVMGSDITYRCLGNGKYAITLTVYRDCNGIQLSNSPISAKCKSGSGSASFSLTETKVRDVTGIGSNCPTNSRCSGSYTYGVEEHTYEGTINLSSLNCCEVIISWEQCCRNGAITTGASGANFFTEAVINKCINPCNSSPNFTSSPAALICVGQDFIFNNGASDTVDVGDSLSYRLVDPLSGSGAKIAYSGSWSKTSPITFLGFPYTGLSFPAGFNLDSVTGDLAFRPTKQNEVSVMVIEVTEWRTINGTPTIVGITRRDMQIIVTPCPDNKVPKLKGQSAVACSGQQVCVTVTTDDDDKDDTTTVSWNKGIPRATFTNNNGSAKHAGGSVCWTPTKNDVSNIPYTFTVTAKDDACPRPGQAIRAFSITVRESPEAVISATKLICGKVAVDFTPAKNNYPGLTYDWVVKDSNNQTIATSYKKKDTIQMQPGTNRLFLTLKTSTPCVNAFVDTIIIDPFVQVFLPKDTFICNGNEMTIPAVTKNGVPAFHYKWSTGDTAVTSIKVNNKVDSSFAIYISDAAGCENTDTIKVVWKPLPPINNIPDARICYDALQIFDGGNDSTKLKYLWSTGDTSRLIYVNDSNQYRLRVTDSIGCHNYDTAMLFVNTVPVDAGSNQAICDKDTAHFNATGADSYIWYLAPNYSTPVSTATSYSLIVDNDKELVIKGTRTYAGLTCSNTDTVALTRNPLPVIKFNPIAPRCVNDNPYFLTPEAVDFNTLSNGTWEGVSNPNIVAGNFFQPKIAGAGTHILKYSVVDNNGCKSSGITSAVINALPPTKVVDNSYCGYDGLINMGTLMDAATGTVIGTKVWKSLDPQADAALTQQGFGAYFLNVNQLTQNQTYPFELRVLSSQTGCTNYDTANITVREVPNVYVVKNKDICQNDPSFNLDVVAQPAPSGGLWSQKSGGVGLENVNVFNPLLADSNNSINYVYYTYDIPGNNCPVTDSIAVRVKPRPTVTIIAPGQHCIDEGTVVLTANPSNGIWGGDANVSSSGNFNAQTAGAGTYNLTFDHTAANGCKWQATGNITIMPVPTLTVTVPAAACQGELFKLDAQYTVATGVQWTTKGDGSFDNTLAPAPIYTPGNGDISDEKFVISVSTTGTQVCSDISQEYSVGIFTNPEIAVTAVPDEGCEPLPVKFTATSNQESQSVYAWNFNDPTSSTNTGTKKVETHEFAKFGTYTVTLRVTNSVTTCFSDAAPTTVTVLPTPNANFKMSREITTVAATDITFSNLSTIGGTGVIASNDWEFGDLAGSTSKEKNPVFEYPTDTGKYIIKLTVRSDKGNCKSEHWDTLTINPDITVFVPNAFTPNLYGPERNNRFYVTAEGYEAFEVFIFSRWGEKVYYSTDITEGWNGMYKGETAQ
jgi:PKD repeat protein